MSEGNSIIKFRVEPHIEERINRAIESANRSTREEPYTISSWMRKCVMDRLNHLERGRGQRVTGGQNEQDGTSVQTG